MTGAQAFAAMAVGRAIPSRRLTRRSIHAAIVALAPGIVTLSGCLGAQSTLDPAGRGAERIADLFWGMTIGAVLIWLGFVVLMLYSAYFARKEYTAKTASLLVIAGGIVFPTVVLTGLLTYALAMLPSFLAPAPEGSLKILVTGEQWWWRVRYFRPNGEPVDAANEIRLPLGAPVEFELESPDVIHSFWIPSLGGKVDMIPGRKTRLRLEPTRAGVFRGVCAEYCGTSHALMAFWVVVEQKEQFEAWLAEQAKPATPPHEPLARQGREFFLANGCGACHAVRGTAADGVVGPDLTHAGSRLSLGAGVFTNEADEFRQWIAHTNDKKPGVRMPAFGMLPPEQVQALAVYLEGLQ
jgi:cytochrome c oxidase subunit 2